MSINWLKCALWKHHWKYRNPYDRTCTVCGRKEIAYCPSMEDWYNRHWEAILGGSVEKNKMNVEVDEYKLIVLEE